MFRRLSVLGCWAERLRVDALGGDTIRLEAILDARHESRWTAQVVVGVGCLDEIAEEFWADPSLDVVVDPELVPLRRPAVGDQRLQIRMAGSQLDDFAGERVVGAVASPVWLSVEPIMPNL